MGSHPPLPPPPPSTPCPQVVGLKWYNMQGERWMDALTEASVTEARPRHPRHQVRGVRDEVGRGFGGWVWGGGGERGGAGWGGRGGRGGRLGVPTRLRDPGRTPDGAGERGGQVKAKGGSPRSPPKAAPPCSALAAHPPCARPTPQVDVAWQAHLGELQGTAERLARGHGLRLLGQMGAEELRLRHPDYEFFNSRG
jgi:hypothetical protein